MSFASVPRIPRGIKCHCVAAAVTGVLLFQIAANAGIYYVDFIGGNDGNSGTSPTTAWQHCPGDTNAMSVPHTNAFLPGDKVIFKGGVAYTNIVCLHFSGTLANPITYDGNSAGTFGTGRAILDGQYTNLYGFESTNGQSYTRAGNSNLVLNYFEICHQGGHSNITWACGALPTTPVSYGMMLADCSQILVSNCYIHDIGDWTNAPNMDAAIMIGNGLQIYGGASNITVANCEFTHIGKAAVSVQARTVVTNLYILNCNVHDYVVWAVNLADENNGSQTAHVIIDGLLYHDCYQYSPNTWVGCSNDWPHSDGIFLFLGGGVTNALMSDTNNPTIIRNCLFYNNADPSVYTAGTACIYLSPWGGTVLVDNCVFENVLNSGEGAILINNSANYSAQPPDFRFLNNTFLDTNHLMIYARSLTNGSLSVSNNIFYNLAARGGSVPIWIDAPTFSATSISKVFLDYNLYCGPNASIARMDTNTASAFENFSQFQAAGFEKHGLNLNPTFVSALTGCGTSTSLNNLREAATSRSIGVGANLSGSFTTDMAGTPRPPTGGWDVGAYQYQSALLPPTNLRIVP